MSEPIDEAVTAVDEEAPEPISVSTVKKTDRKCPNCGGTVSFDPASGHLLCDYCQTELSIDEVDADDEDETAESLMAKSGAGKKASLAVAELDLAGLLQSAPEGGWGDCKKVVSCKACGADIVYDADQIADVCPYCGSNHVMPANDQHTLAPSGICPFVVTQDEAREHFSKWIAKRWFVPSIVQKAAKPESFRGIYLPYWTFDVQTDTKYSALYGIDRQVRVGKKLITKTKWRTVSGQYSEFFDDYPVVGTKHHSQELKRGIEPFNTDESVVYNPQYTAGFLAERYSVEPQEAWKKAQQGIAAELRENIEAAVRHSKRADHVSFLVPETEIKSPKYKYLLLPVWLSTFKYQNKVYFFAVNGQTGSVDGKVPYSLIKILLVAVPCAALVFLLPPLWPALIVIGFVALIVWAVCNSPSQRVLSKAQKRKRKVEHHIDKPSLWQKLLN